MKMKKMLNKIKAKNGYVSIETVIIAGLLIALAVVILSGLKKKADKLSGQGSSQLNNADKEYADLIGGSTTP